MMVTMATTAQRKSDTGTDTRRLGAVTVEQAEGFDRNELRQLAEESTTRWSELLDRLAR